LLIVHDRKWTGVTIQRANVHGFTICMPQFVGSQKMANCRRIVAMARQRRLDRVPQLAVAVLRLQFQHIDHLSRTALLSVTFDQRLPESIEAHGP
jgi:hypothetical protein